MSNHPHPEKQNLCARCGWPLLAVGTVAVIAYAIMKAITGGGGPESLKIGVVFGNGTVINSDGGNVIAPDKRTGAVPDPIDLVKAPQPVDYSYAGTALNELLEAIDGARRCTTNLALARARLTENRQADDADGVRTFERSIAADEERFRGFSGVLAVKAKAYDQLPADVRRSVEAAIDRRRAADLAWLNQNARALTDPAAVAAALSSHFAK